MSEEDFWRQFFDSHYFHRDRMRVMTSAKRKTDLISQSAEKDESGNVLGDASFQYNNLMY